MKHLSDKRRGGLIITASKAYAAVYERQELWREMTWRTPTFQGNEMTQWGIDNEPVALSQFERDMGEICEPGNVFVPHESKPFGASPDAYLNGEPVEIKCPFTQQVYDGIPDRYYFQVQMQLECTNTESAWFYCWTPHTSTVQKVARNREWWEWYEPLALEFLEYVRTDTEPKRWKKKPIFNKEQ